MSYVNWHGQASLSVTLFCLALLARFAGLLDCSRMDSTEVPSEEAPSHVPAASLDLDATEAAEHAQRLARVPTIAGLTTSGNESGALGHPAPNSLRFLRTNSPHPAYAIPYFPQTPLVKREERTRTKSPTIGRLRMGLSSKRPKRSGKTCTG